MPGKLRHCASMHDRRTAARAAQSKFNRRSAPKSNVKSADGRIRRGEHQTSKVASPARTPFDLQEHRTRRLDARYRLLPARRRIRTIDASAKNVAQRHHQQGQELWPARPRRSWLLLRFEMELHQVGRK